MKDFPDIARSLQRIKLVLDLEERANENTILGMAIKQAINDKQPASEVIKWVKSQAEDCPKVMADVIGEELTERIINFH